MMDVQLELHRQHVARRSEWRAAAVRLEARQLPTPEEMLAIERREAEARQALLAAEAERRASWEKYEAHLDVVMGEVRAGMRRLLRHAAIIREVAELHGRTVSELKSESRNQAKVHARQEAAYRLADETALSFPQIGGMLGGRDHSTVIHAIRAHARRRNLALPRGMSPKLSVRP